MKLQILNATHLLHQRVELDGQGSDVLENEAKEHESKVAVDRRRARLVGEWSTADRLLERDASGMFAKERQVRRQTAAVCQQIANGHRWPGDACRARAEMCMATGSSRPSPPRSTARMMSGVGGEDLRQ